MPRLIRIEGNAAYVPLTKGYEAVIDAADAVAAGQFDWCAREDRRKDGTVRAVYAVRKVFRNGKPAQLSLHRFLLAEPDGLEVDHADGDGLNCRRVNLRPATKSENQANARKSSNNTSGQKGVLWAAHRNKWRAQIKENGQYKHLGLFNCRTAAAIAYAKAAQAVYGNFARPF